MGKEENADYLAVSSFPTMFSNLFLQCVLKSVLCGRAKFFKQKRNSINPFFKNTNLSLVETLAFTQYDLLGDPVTVFLIDDSDCLY